MSDFLQDILIPARPAIAGIRRVAFFGGSFDPPHLGHLAVARAAQQALALDTVLFAPVGTQPLKPSGAAVSFEDRAAMTRLAIANQPGFELSLLDAPQPSGALNFTFETLAALRSQLIPGSELFCLIGADSLTALSRWHRAAELPFLAPLIVASRPGEPIDDLSAILPEGLTIEANLDRQEPTVQTIELRSYLLRNSSGSIAPFYLLPGLHIEISASQIRNEIRATSDGKPITENLLPAAVSQYIRSRGLYL